jgi:hypothetical protein
MTTGQDGAIATRRETGQTGRRYKPLRCSICMKFIWSHPIVLEEPIEVPEPRFEWILCKACHEALLMEMDRSSLRLPVRLRIAMGLVAAERSPKAYSNEQQVFQREFTWVMRLLILFALLHVVIFIILMTVPR